MCFFCFSLRLIIPTSKSEKYSFYYKGPIPRFTKACLLLSRSYTDICSFYVKSCQGDSSVRGSI